MNFEQALARTGRFEAGFQNDPKDAGNWTGGAPGKGENRGTNYGISARAYPTLDIKALTWDQAAEIYQRDYWVKAGCNVLPDIMRGEVFDVAVLSGVTRAVQCVQRATRVISEKSCDGVFGPVTKWAVEQSNNPAALLRRFDGHFLDFLNNNREQWALYGAGWVQRVAQRMIETN